MTPAEFATLVRFETGTDSSRFTDAQILALAGAHMDDIAKEIVKRNEDYFVVPAVRDLVADQREYSFPDDMLAHMKYVEAMLDAETWKRLAEFDLNTYRKTTDETTIRAMFAGKDPAFDIERFGIFIYSDSAIENVTEGLKLWYPAYPRHISDLASATDMAVAPSTTEAGWPRPFHLPLARRVIRAWKQSKNVALNQDDLEADKNLELALESISGQNLDRDQVRHVPYSDGQDY